MVQTRRTSTTKRPPKQGPTEPTESIKNMQQNQQASTGIPTTTPVKPRRPSSPRANEMIAQNNKSYLKDSPSKPDRSSEPDDPDSTGKMMDKSSVRTVVCDSVYPGNRTLMIISLPTEDPRPHNPYLKNMASSESVDDLESTTKEDLEFLDDDSDMTISSEFPAIVVYASSSKPDDSIPTVPTSEAEITEVDTIGKFPAEPPVQTKSLHHGLDILAAQQHLYSSSKGMFNISNTVDAIGDASPTSSTTVPRAPPITPATPKREIKLVTAGSRAADWFTHGFVGVISKETKPPSVTDPHPIKLEPLSPEKIDVQPDLVNLQESPACVEQPVPLSVPEGTTANVKLDIPFDVDESVLAAFISFSVNLFRPYVRRPVGVTSTTVPTPCISEKPPATDNSKDQVSTSIPELAHSPVSLDKITTDDKLDGSMVVVKNTAIVDEEILKRRWYREEMRQSPERDGSWTIEEGERNCTSNVAAASSLEQTVHSVSNDYVLVESTENKTSVNAVEADGNELPLVISMDTNDNVITEPVTIDASRPQSHGIFSTIPSIANADHDFDSSNGTRETVKPKFFIIGGKVQRAQDVSKQDAHTVDDSRSQAPETRRSLQNIFRGLGEKQYHLQRSKPKKPHVHKKKISVTGASDGWSTEDDIPATSHIIANPPDLPGMLTDITVSVPTDEVIVSPLEIVENTPTEMLTDTIATVSGDVEQEDNDRSAVIDDLCVTIDEIAPSSETDQDDVEHPVVEIEVIEDTITVDNHVQEESTPPSSQALAEVIHTADIGKSTSKIVGKSPAYQIVAGTVVRRDSRPSTPSKIQIVTAIDPSSTTPLLSPARSTSSQHSPDPPPPSIRRKEQTQSYDSHMGRVRSIISPRTGPKIDAPEAAKKFVECGDMADRRAIGSLTRQRAPCPGTPQHNHQTLVFGPAKTPIQDDAITESSKFGYGKTTPINQPSVREETFDPFDKESPKSLKHLIEKNTPLLDTVDSRELKTLLEKAPNCFCGKMCARFDGVVPVYVCGCFRRVFVMSSDTRGCAFHMHVPFWECLRDTFHSSQYNQEMTFSSDALNPHLNACPYLNFTFCVKFSQRNAFNMYLPAEIRATNICACDLDMRLDFSRLLKQWTFSCPHYHQQGALKKCVRRVFVSESRYKLMESSPNLHGGAPLPVNAQTVAMYEKKPSKEPDPAPIVHFPSIGNPKTAPKQVQDEEDIFKTLYRTATVNQVGSKEWLGESATGDQLADWERQKEESDKGERILIDRVRDQYLILEKMLDEALCQKIKDEEQRKREETKMRLKANVVPCTCCCEAIALCVFVPCFHMVLCEKCAEKVSVCPTCRKPIENRQRVYTA